MSTKRDGAADRPQSQLVPCPHHDDAATDAACPACHAAHDKSQVVMPAWFGPALRVARREDAIATLLRRDPRDMAILALSLQGDISYNETELAVALGMAPGGALDGTVCEVVAVLHHLRRSWLGRWLLRRALRCAGHGVRHA